MPVTLWQNDNGTGKSSQDVIDFIKHVMKTNSKPSTTEFTTEMYATKKNPACADQSTASS